MLNLNRDSVWWGAGLIGGAIVAVGSHLDLFPWFSPQTQHWIELAAFVITAVSGKMATSPLPGNPHK